MRHYFHIIWVVVMAVALSSCELETSDNKDLDGMWRLASVDTLATGNSADMSGKKIYWSFQYKLLQFDDYNGNNQSLLLRFEHSGNSLRVYDPYIYDREDGDIQLTDVSLLAPFGVNSLEETFTVEALGGGKMVLCSPTLRLGFRKL